MVECPNCHNMVEEGKFCSICSKSLAPPPVPSPTTRDPVPTPAPDAAPEGVMSRVEKKVFFKIARGYAWLIAFIAALGLAFAITRVVPLMLATFSMAAPW